MFLLCCIKLFFLAQGTRIDVLIFFMIIFFCKPQGTWSPQDFPEVVILF